MAEPATDPNEPNGTSEGITYTYVDPAEARENPELRNVLDRSRSGAPSSGDAVRDIFSTDEIFLRIMANASEEFSRSTRLLFLSGLAAGLSIGLTFLARAGVTGVVPEDQTGLVGNLLYPIGFLFIVLGRYQLFTENTLTPVTLVLTRLASLPRLLKIWGIVYGANVIGAAIAATLFSKTGVLDPPGREAAFAFGTHAMEVGWNAIFFKGLVAGWLVGGMVWLSHAARDTTARFLIVYFVMFLIPSLGLFHCITGACEVFYYVLEGGTTLQEAVFDFIAPVTLGNTAGGVLLVAILNFAQTREKRIRELEMITWREWFLGERGEREQPRRPRA